jgi:hypothetical protein
MRQIHAGFERHIRESDANEGCNCWTRLYAMTHFLYANVNRMVKKFVFLPMMALNRIC